MAKLHFFYSVMNAGKSAQLLQVAHNYETLGYKVIYLTSATDDRKSVGVISSRIGLTKQAYAIKDTDDLYDFCTKLKLPNNKKVVFVDEVQFFTREQIIQLSDIADYLDYPVLCYGLKNNSNGELFSPAIEKLLAYANDIKEIKTICHCGAKATQILRYKNSRPVLTNDIIEVGDSEYKSVCRHHWKYAFAVDEVLKNEVK